MREKGLDLNFGAVLSDHLIQHWIDNYYVPPESIIYDKIYEHITWVTGALVKIDIISMCFSEEARKERGEYVDFLMVEKVRTMLAQYVKSQHKEEKGRLHDYQLTDWGDGCKNIIYRWDRQT